MKISYNWLKQYLKTDINVEDAAAYLTGSGLEVESIEPFESLKGGLEGFVIGEVKTRSQHPNADRLSLTTVDIGTGSELSIVCGAPNVTAGQKVVVATIGTTVYPLNGEPFKIKESKIRGELSQGMICAEDEMGIGESHDGILVLDSSAPVGTPAAHYFKIEKDYILEIGLTPNRSDAASHIGVARDLSAVLNNYPGIENKYKAQVDFPSVDTFKTDNNNLVIPVEIEDPALCPRYSSLTISGVEVKESPDWLKNRLKSIGLKPINNIVDVTNFVLHELGQPLHAFDASRITGGKVLVKKLAAGTKFTTLDEVERTLNGEELMICNTQSGMCIAGVFGGKDSGINENTKNVFLESAYFNPVSIRKTSKHHGLKTDASFRFERGTDPNITVYALKRAALLIKEVAGGTISSEINDIYPLPVQDFKIDFSFANAERLIGYKIGSKTIENILQSLGIKIESGNNEGLKLAVPPFKVDALREVDIIEEILRIYGYNNIPLTPKLHSSLTYRNKPEKEKIQETIADYLSSNGFNEIMSLSLTKSGYMNLDPEVCKEEIVSILNPLSSDLDILRFNMIFGGLEAIEYNKNRKNSDLKLYEFGFTYHKTDSGYQENKHLSLFITGQKQSANWDVRQEPTNFFHIKGIVEKILLRLGIKTSIEMQSISSPLFTEALQLNIKGKTLAEIGKISKNILKTFDLNQEVYYADLNWEEIVRQASKSKTSYREIPKFPEVKRDLALLLDKSVTYNQLEKVSFETERNLLKKVSLFDVYEGEKIEAGKKSYALSFILQDEEKTLTDKQIDKIMERLIESFEKKLNATIRK